MISRLPLCLSSLLLLTVSSLAAQEVRVVRTTQDLSEALSTQPSLRFAAAPSSPSVATITVDSTQRMQMIDGFGAAMTEGSAWLLQEQLTAEQRHSVLTQLFDPEHGAGLSFLRLPIASTDLSRTHYSYDDMPAGQQDPAMHHFSAAQDEAEIFPLVREALRLNPSMTIMATPWSQPAWMKTKLTMNGGMLRPDAEAAFAAYLVRSLQSMQHSGIPVKFLSIQNEPLNETHDYPGTLLKADQAKRFIGQDLGPALRMAGLRTEVLAYDHNWDHPEYPLEVLADPAARPFTAGSALHCYGGNVAAQDGIHEAEPTKGIWMTECSGGTWQKEPPLSSTARLLIGSTNHWAKAVVLWGIALGPDGNPHAGGCGTCRGLVTIDWQSARPTVTYNGDFYALAQASKFVHPGAVRIASAHIDGSGLENVAFQNTDRSIALLVLNANACEKRFTVQSSGQSFSANLPAGSLATYTWTVKP